MSDFLTSLVRRARGESPQVRPVSRLYREPDEPVEVVEEEEYGEAAAPALAGEPRPRAVIVAQPEVAPLPATTQAQVSADPVRPVVERPRPAAPPMQRTIAPPRPTPPGREEAPPDPPTPRPDEQTPPRARRKRPPRVDEPSVGPTASVRGVVVERRIEAVIPEDDQAAPALVRPAEPLRRAARPQPKPPRHRIEPGLPSPPIREQIVFAPKAAPEPSPIHVSIGRVELRAPAPPPGPSPVELARPKQSLDDYLLARDRRRA